MALTEIQLAEIKKLLDPYCAGRSPERVRDKLRVEYRIDGNAVTLVEVRPRFRNPAEWVDISVARFRYNQSRWEWALFWRDRNDRWHRYTLKRPAKRLSTLLEEVDRDPTGIFWG